MLFFCLNVEVGNKNYLKLMLHFHCPYVEGLTSNCANYRILKFKSFNNGCYHIKPRFMYSKEADYFFEVNFKIILFLSLHSLVGLGAMVRSLY